MTKEFRARLINLWLNDPNSPHPSERLCCIKNCANTRDLFMYHPLPEYGKVKIGELDLKRIWMQNCQIPYNANDNNKYFVCNKHFILSDYSISKNKVKLRRNAVPVLYLPSDVTIRRGRKKKQMVQQSTEKVVAPLVNIDNQLETIQSESIQIEQPVIESQQQQILPQVESPQPLNEINDSIKIESNLYEQNIYSNDELDSYYIITEQQFDKCTQVCNEDLPPLPQPIPPPPPPPSSSSSSSSSQQLASAISIKLRIQSIIKSDAELKEWTGIRKYELLAKITIFVNSKINNGSILEQEIKLHDRIILVLIKLKTNLSFILIASIFNIDHDAMVKNFALMIPLLKKTLHNCIIFPYMEQIRSKMPIHFKTVFFFVRAILDTFEINIEIPHLTDDKINLLNYRSANSLKFIICCTLSGQISFISKAYSGKSSDKFIFHNENLIDKFTKMIDAILIVKGFHEIEQDLIANFIKSYRLSNGIDYEYRNNAISSLIDITILQEFIENVLERLKTYSILHRIEYNLLPYIDDIIYLIGCFVNLNM